MKGGSGWPVARADSAVGTEPASPGVVDRMADARRLAVFGGTG